MVWTFALIILFTNGTMGRHESPPYPTWAACEAARAEAEATAVLKPGEARVLAPCRLRAR